MSHELEREGICNLCGNPIELCQCNIVRQELQENIKILVDRRKWGRAVTIIQGLDEREISLPKLAKRLKNKLACGGTVKDGNIELQGEHMFDVRDLLIEQGFSKESIEIDLASAEKSRKKR
ncbi:MAG: stress response translation initiation inhibitor YciH [Promethearchaeota archaeon]